MPSTTPGVTGFYCSPTSWGELLGEAIPAVNAEGPHEDWSAVVDTVSEAKRFKSLPLHRLHSFRHEAYADVHRGTTFLGSWSRDFH